MYLHSYRLKFRLSFPVLTIALVHCNVLGDVMNETLEWTRSSS